MRRSHRLGGDPCAERWVGQGAAAGPEIVNHVLRAGGRGDRAGDRRVGDHEFQQKLRPARAADLGRPRRQRLAPQPPKELTAGKGSVDDHRHAALKRERQQALLGLTLADRIVDLDEIECLSSDHSLHRCGAHDEIAITPATYEIRDAANK